MRMLLAGVVLGATLAGGISSALASTPLTPYTMARVDSQDPQPAGRWSERLATVPDFNHDGVNELLIADLNESYGGFSQAGRVYMQEGKTRKIMYSVDAPEIQAGAHFGFFISVIGDVNGDGVADFAAGTDAQNVDASGASCTKGTPGCVAGQGKAWVFSGANGRMLYALSNPDPQAAARFGSRVGRAGDINRDGVQDIIVGASGSDMPTGCGHDQTTGKALAAIPAGCRVGEGAAYIFSGKDGSLIRTLHLPAADEAPAPCKSSCGSFGLAVQGPGDMNGDGTTDQLVDAGSFNYDTATQRACTDQLAPTCNKGQGAEYVFSGKDGSVIRRTDDPSPQKGAFFGFQDAEPLAPGDVNGDGVPDYFANGFEQNGPPPGNLDSAGRAWVFSGKTGALLYEVKTPTPTAGGQFGFSMAKTDYDRDGDSDVYVGASPHHTSGAGIDQSGGTFIFDGKTGALLKALVLPRSDAQPGDTLANGDDNNGSNLGWTVAAPGDLNGDGQPDYVAGSPFEDVGGAGLPLNCQAPTPGCVQDVGREYFFYSNVPAPKPPPPPPSGHRFNVNRVIIHAHKRRVAHGNTLVTFNGTVVVPGFLN
ncbi:MAG: VCBS repeat-containing protein, partial [Solirubrobacteraceae bacterium]